MPFHDQPPSGGFLAGYNSGMRFRLRTLLILLAVLPQILAALWVIRTASQQDQGLAALGAATGILFLWAWLYSKIIIYDARRRDSGINR
jgi:uncharacterized membrane protein YqaE (UPF0057 family)